MPKRSIYDLDVKGRRLFIRVDFNVPLKAGRISDDTRIRSALPTLQYALEQGASLVLASHLGRPKGQRQGKLSLKPIAIRLSELLNQPVAFTNDCVGPEALETIEQAGRNGVTLLENLRFHKEEEDNDPIFSASLASLADCYVNDAFGSAHRAHASTTGIVPHVSDAAAGLLLARELKHLGALLDNPARPFTAILGGSKVSGKLEVIRNLLPRIDTLLIGGAMSYTFFKAQGLSTGRSLVEPELVDATREIEQEAKVHRVNLMLPCDHLVATALETDASHENLGVESHNIGDRIGVDIGPETQQSYADIIKNAATVVWNGPMGVFEIPPFSSGTLAVAMAVAASNGTTVVGGGDSVSAVGQMSVADQITHISTGGGASLEFLGGTTLPGVAALPNT
ncbi:MAG: phosphoglycerate kinase [Acidobacteriota bacterium]|nr:phosphoglycerate kinase [Acidobacteriota bacterium]